MLEVKYLSSIFLKSSILQIKQCNTFAFFFLKIKHIVRCFLHFACKLMAASPVSL